MSVYIKALTTFVDGHKSSDMFLASCEGLKSLCHSDSALAVLGNDVLKDFETRLRELVFSLLQISVYSMECVVALLEVAVGVVPLVQSVEHDQPTEQEPARSEWLVAGLLHVLFHWKSFEDDLDVSILFTLLRRFCASSKIRNFLYEHVDYGKLVEILVSFSQDSKWRRWRKYALSMLRLLGEEGALEQANQIGILGPEQALSSSLHCDSTTCATRCFHCRQVVYTPMQANLCVVPCSYCQKPVAVASDSRPSTADPTLFSVLDDGNATNDRAFYRLSSTEDHNFVCVNCNNVLELPDGLSPSEIVCPHCLQLASVKKTNQSGVPGFSSETKKSSVRSMESGTSLRKDPSLSGINVRDTKVVSCGHCNKHLIVKNGASAVKCPSCHGVSKLSTTTKMMRCKNCNTLLSLPAGARAYKCMKCLQTTRLS